MPVTPITLASAIPVFAEHQRSYGLSKATVDNRVLYLKRLMRLCPEGQIVSQLTVDDIAALFGLYPEPRQAGSYNMAYQSLNAFLPWAVTKKYLSRSRAAELMEGRHGRKYKRQEPYILPAEKLRPAIEAAWSAHPRDGMIVSSAVYMLARESELVAIQLKHIHLADREIVGWREKQDEMFTWAICPPHMEDLLRYLGWMAETTGCESIDAMMADHPDWYLHSALMRGCRKGDSRGLRPDVGLRHVTSAVKKALDALGVETPSGHGKVSRNLGTGAHTLRRSGGRAELAVALASGESEHVAVPRIQERMGHGEEKMTWRYLGLNERHDRAVEHYKHNDPYAPKVPSAPVVPEPENVVVVDFASRARKARSAL